MLTLYPSQTARCTLCDVEKRAREIRWFLTSPDGRSDANAAPSHLCTRCQTEQQWPMLRGKLIEDMGIPHGR